MVKKGVGCMNYEINVSNVDNKLIILLHYIINTIAKYILVNLKNEYLISKNIS